MCSRSVSAVRLHLRVSMTILMDTSAVRALEHELVTAKASIALEALESEAAIVEEVEQFVSFGGFVGIAADPVDDVAPFVHAAVGAVTGPLAHVVHRPAAQE